MRPLILLTLLAACGDKAPVDSTTTTSTPITTGSWQLSASEVTVNGTATGAEVLAEREPVELAFAFLAASPESQTAEPVVLGLWWDDTPVDLAGCLELGSIGTGVEDAVSGSFDGPQGTGERTLHAGLLAAADCTTAGGTPLATAELATVSAMAPVRLEVYGTLPTQGATDVDIQSSQLSVQFTEPVDPNTVEGHISLEGPQGPVPFTLSVVDTTVFLDLDAMLVPMATEHLLTVDPGVLATSGNLMVSPYELRFQTELLDPQVLYTLFIDDGVVRELSMDPFTRLLAIQLNPNPPTTWFFEPIPFTIGYQLTTEVDGTGWGLSGGFGTPELVPFDPAALELEQMWYLTDADEALLLSTDGLGGGFALSGDAANNPPSMRPADSTDPLQRILLSPVGLRP